MDVILWNIQRIVIGLGGLCPRVRIIAIKVLLIREHENDLSNSKLRRIDLGKDFSKSNRASWRKVPWVRVCKSSEER